jgi:hypothetical protein
MKGCTLGNETDFGYAYLTTSTLWMTVQNGNLKNIILE